MAVKYRRKKDDKILTYAQRMPRLERSKNFERVEPKANESTATRKTATRKTATKKKTAGS